jgi:hypothetical protein
MRTFFVFAFILCQLQSMAQPATKLVIVTLDGLRWQEVFGGVDDSLSRDSLFTRDRDGMKSVYGSSSAAERREKLPRMESFSETAGRIINWIMPIPIGFHIRVTMKFSPAIRIQR